MGSRRCPKCGGILVRRSGFAQEPGSPPDILFSRFSARARWKPLATYVCVKCGFTECVPE